MDTSFENVNYAGFWVRTGAAIIDSILILLLIAPILTLIYGSNYWLDEQTYYGPWEFVFNYIVPAVVVIVFWAYKSATPGKMILNIKIVDAETKQAVPTPRLIGRYLGYYVSCIPLLLGIIWVGFDSRKQGWHDKLAKTIVIYDEPEQN